MAPPSERRRRHFPHHKRADRWRRSDQANRLDRHVGTTVNHGRFPWSAARVDGHELLPDDPGPHQDPTPPVLGRLGRDVVDGDVLDRRLETLLDDEGLAVAHGAGEPLLPVVFRPRTADENAVGARAAAVGTRDLQDQLLTAGLVQVQERLERAHPNLPDRERKVGLADRGVDHPRTRNEHLEDGHGLGVEQLCVDLLVVPEEREQRLVAEEAELRDHLHLALLRRDHQIRDAPRRLEDGELPPDRPHLLAVEADLAVRDDDAILGLAGGDHMDVVTQGLHLLDEPGRRADVDLAPLVRDDEEEHAVPGEELEGLGPRLDVDAVGAINVHQVRKPPGHLVVLAGHQRAPADVHVRPANRPAHDALCTVVRLQVAVAELRPRGVQLDPHHELVAELRLADEELRAGVLEVGNGLERRHQLRLGVLGRHPRHALPRELDTIRDRRSVRRVDLVAQVRSVVEALDEIRQVVRREELHGNALTLAGRTPGELLALELTLEVTVEVGRDLVGAAELTTTLVALGHRDTPQRTSAPGGKGDPAATAREEGEQVAVRAIEQGDRAIGRVPVREGGLNVGVGVENLDVKRAGLLVLAKLVDHRDRTPLASKGENERRLAGRRLLCGVGEQCCHRSLCLSLLWMCDCS